MSDFPLISWDVWWNCFSVTLISLFLAITSNFFLDLHFMCTICTFLALSSFSSAGLILLDSLLLKPSEGKAILITGCDTGFGNAVVRKLHRLGFTVFAGCISNQTEGAQALRDEFRNDGRMHVLPMDVTSDESCALAIDFIQKNLPSSANGGLWAVITNAGMAGFGHVEWTPMTSYKQIMEINFFGTLRTIKFALPLIRRAKGRIVTISSQMGLFGNVSRSSYCCSKWAVEGLVECLRPEMKPWGVHVTCIEPGNFVSGTNIFGDDKVRRTAQDMWNQMPVDVQEDYIKADFDAAVEKFNYFVKNGNSRIEPVLQTMIKAVSQRYPCSRYTVGTWREKLRILIADHCPTFIYDRIYNN